MIEETRYKEKGKERGKGKMERKKERKRTEGGVKREKRGRSLRLTHSAF